MYNRCLSIRYPNQERKREKEDSGLSTWAEVTLWRAKRKSNVNLYILGLRGLYPPSAIISDANCRFLTFPGIQRSFAFHVYVWRQNLPNRTNTQKFVSPLGSEGEGSGGRTDIIGIVTLVPHGKCNVEWGRGLRTDGRTDILQHLCAPVENGRE